MNGGLHGRDAIRDSGKCGWCVDPHICSTPPSRHSNVSEPAKRTKNIKLELYVSGPGATGPHKYFGRATEVLLDSGAECSIFTAETARELRLDGLIVRSVGEGEDPRRVRLPNGVEVPCCQFSVTVFLGRRHLNIPVLWPLDTGTGQLRGGFPVVGNILGMNGILSENMLCLTPETVYVFPVVKENSGL